MRHKGDALADFSMSREVLAPLRLVAELFLIGMNGFELGFEFGSDVYYERRANIVVERRVDDLERTVGLEVAQPVNLERVDVVGCGGVPETAESGEKAGFVADRGTGVVIGMAALPVGKNHHPRLLLANDARDLNSVGVGIFHSTVGNIERLPPCDLENACGVGGFASATFRRAACA